MLKRIELNDNVYFVQTKIKVKRIELEAFLDVNGGRYPSSYSGDRVELYSSIVTQNSFLSLLNLNVEKRLERKIMKAIKIINKHNLKANELAIADKSCQETFSVDEHLDS